MARVELRSSGGHRYALVVEDVQQEDGRWKKETIESFGNADKGDNLQRAHAFAAAVNASESLLDSGVQTKQADVKQALATILKGALTGALIGSAVGWAMARQKEALAAEAIDEAQNDSTTPTLAESSPPP